MPSQVGRHRPGRPRCAPRGRPAPSATVRDALGRAPDRRQPAREPRQTPAGDARRHPGNCHRGGIRTGSGPVLTRFGVLDPLPASLDTPLMPGRRARNRPHARLAPLGGSRAAHHPPIGAPIRPDRPPPRPARPGSPSRSARAVSTPSPRHRPAPTGSGTPGTHPGHPRSVPARPLRARTLCRSYARRVSDFGFWIGFWNWEIGLGAHRPRSQGIGRWGPARSKRADGTRKISGTWLRGDVGGSGKATYLRSVAVRS